MKTDDVLKKSSTQTLVSLLNGVKKDKQRLLEREKLLVDALNNKVYLDKNGLLSCYAYQHLSDDDKARICNGAGAAGQAISHFIPNSLYFLDCTEVFNIHDFDYYRGKTQKDKDEADRRMLDNLLILINRAGGPLKWLRRRRALKYYEAVHELGDEAFFKDKDISWMKHAI